MSDVRQRQQRREQTQAQVRVERRGERKQQQRGGVFTSRNVILAIAATGALLYFAGGPEPQRWIRQRRSVLPSVSPTDFFVVQSVDRSQAPSACAAQGGSLAPVNSTNFNAATTAAFNAVGANKPLWIQSWNTDSYGGNVVLYTGNKAPGGAVNVGVATNQIAALCLKNIIVSGYCEDMLGACNVAGAVCGSGATCPNTTTIGYPLCTCTTGKRPTNIAAAYHVYNHTDRGNSIGSSVGTDTSLYVAPGVACDANCVDSSCPEVTNKCDTRPDSCFPGYAKILVEDGYGVYEERFKSVNVGDNVRVVDKDGKEKFDEVVYVFRAPVKDVTYTILEYATDDGRTGELHLTPSHMIPITSTRTAARVFVQAKEVLVHTYVLHATHGPVLITANTQRYINGAGAYTAITRTPSSLLIVDDIIASPWAVSHHLLEITFGPVARGLYALLKPLNLHRAVLGSKWIADANDLVGPAIMHAAKTLPQLAGNFIAPAMKL